MDNFWQTFGHTGIKKILEKQIASGSLPHAYLFAGPEGIGKKTLALELARKILKAERLDNHPDFQILDHEGEILIEDALRFLGTIAYKPFMADKKVSIINNAENLNLQSSNSLLKTLEEPPVSSVIILVASQNSVLPTIVSRCQVFNFNSFSAGDLKQYCKLNNFFPDEQALSLSFGKISRLKKFLEDKGFFEEEAEKIKSFQQALRQSLGERLASIASFAEAESLDLKKLLLSWLSWQKQQLAQNPKSFASVAALLEALTALDKNQNKKLILQQLFFKI